MLRFSLLLLCLLTLPSRANLGETVPQCVARYGRPAHFTEAGKGFPFGTLDFTAGGFELIIFLLDVKEVGARVSKADKSAFTPAEMQSIMSADASSPWTVAASTDPAFLRWIRADSATVLYDKEKHLLIFTSQEMALALKDAATAASAGK